MSDAFWTEPVDALLRRLDSAPGGISDATAQLRLARDGPNDLEARRRRSLLGDLARRLSNPLIAILLVAAAIAGFTGDRVSFVLIAAMVLLSTVLDMVQERRAEATAQALRRFIALRANVCRDGACRAIPATEIVAGDIVRLQAGDLIPADGVVLESNSAQVNQAALTGEPYPVSKQPGVPTSEALENAVNALFQGTAMLSGTATMLVVRTGRRTRLGAISTALAGNRAPTAFERGIRDFGALVVRFTVFLALFVLLAHLALGRPPLQTFLFAMALAVGLTPELLPMIITIGLARGARRMAAKKVIVKRLAAIHDLGQMDVLCTDKTGTLTEAHIVLKGHPGVDGKDYERVIELAAVNARFETGLKSPLDEALLRHAENANLGGWVRIDERPFDFERRRISVLVERQGKRIEIVKGAPETILALSRSAEMPDGVILPLDTTLRAQLLQLNDDQARSGFRLLGVAWRPADGQQRIEVADDADLVFVGFCAFEDPAKISATSAIERLERQCIRIKIVSGDAPAVVEHLVAELRLPIGGMLTGTELAAMNDDALRACVDRVDLFARITPDQKSRIVCALAARGHSVGFLGDGINDAPAIEAADVGLSVDGATDVAREAADLILLSPDLGVLADGVAEGRTAYANIMNYIRMGTSSNFGNMLTMAIASLWLPFLPLTPVQVLLNNFLYDMSQTGLPFDDADPEDVAAPHGWSMHELERFTIVLGPLSSLFDLATFWLLTHVADVSVPAFRAAWFMESMATQILVVFVIRTTRRPWRSLPHRMLLASALTSFAVALMLPLSPVAGILGFEAPPLQILAMIAVLVLLYLVGAESLKRKARAGGIAARRDAAPAVSRGRAP